MSLRVRDTVDHDEIRRWIQLHHGAPAGCRTPVSVRPAEVLLVDFLGARSGHYFEHISRGNGWPGSTITACVSAARTIRRACCFTRFSRGATPPTVHAINLSP